jgi:predicted component of type VI protein secretion system
MAETYGIGGTEVKSDANEAFAEIPQNRTLMVEKLTNDPPVKPEILTGLKSIDEVFEHFKPEVEVEFENADGVGVNETLNFKNLGDFGAKGITKQSKFLQDLDTEKDQYVNISKQLKTNKLLKTAIADPEAKQSILDAIRALLTELEEKK